MCHHAQNVKTKFKNQKYAKYCLNHLIAHFYLLIKGNCNTITMTLVAQYVCLVNIESISNVLTCHFKQRNQTTCFNIFFLITNFIQLPNDGLQIAIKFKQRECIDSLLKQYLSRLLIRSDKIPFQTGTFCDLLHNFDAHTHPLPACY